MTAPIRRRLTTLEIANNAVGEDDAPVDWGAGYEHLPAMTKGELRRMLRSMHDNGSGKLPISPPRQAHGRN